MPVPPEFDLTGSPADRVLGTADAAFVVAEWTEPGGPPGLPRLVAPLHLHHEEDEAWYVLEGTLRFRLGDRELDVPAGSGLFGPRQVPHTFWNPAPEPARYLVVLTPNTLRLIEEISRLSDRTPGALQALFREYGCEIVE